MNSSYQTMANQLCHTVTLCPEPMKPITLYSMTIIYKHLIIRWHSDLKTATYQLSEGTVCTSYHITNSKIALSSKIAPRLHDNNFEVSRALHTQVWDRQTDELLCVMWPLQGQPHNNINLLFISNQHTVKHYTFAAS